MRIDFQSADAAEFNALRDQWREAAAGAKISKIAHKLASLLPGYVNRDLGYAFPTDLQLAEIASATVRTITRGMAALEAAGLVARETITKRDAKGEAIGKLRRIFLTLPQAVEVNGQEVNGQPEVNGQNQAGEWTTGVHITLITNTPDNSDSAPKPKAGASARPQVPAREGRAGVYHGDLAFLDAFDREVVAMTEGQQIGAGAIGDIVKVAFDRATASDRLFMPFDWDSVRHLRSPDTRDWFFRRAGQLVLKKAA